jgi:Carboxypeptidase regulatory-like domain
MSEILQPGHHPDADQLSAFMEHALPAHEYQQTLAHLADCPQCRSVVALSLPPVDESPILQAKEVRRSWFRGWNLAWSTAAVACAALAVFFVVHIHQTVAHRPSASTAAQMAESHTPAPAAVAGQSSAALPLQGRNPARSTKRRPSPSNADNIFTAGQRLSPATAPGVANSFGEAHVAAAPTTVTASEALGVIRQIRPLDQAESTVLRHPLPSHLPALSVVSAGQRILVIDTQNTVFFSDDRGDHWKAIPSHWQGRAVKVELASSTVPRRPISTTLNGKPGFGVIGGTIGGPLRLPNNSSLTGTVKDPTGAVIPGVSVVVSNATNISDPVKTDSDGRYVVNNLSPGSYAVEAQAPGFDTQQTPVTLIASQQTALNFILSVGRASQSVTVEAAASPSPSLPVVRKMIAKPPSPIRFEITTDAGEHWTSTDGQIWTHK